MANPNDPILLNNLVYSYAISGELNKENKYLKRFMEIDFNKLPLNSRITVQATYGLVAIRTGEIEMGKKIYQIAIQNASKLNNIYLKNLALVHYTRELIYLNDNDKNAFLDKVKAMEMGTEHPDLTFIRNEVLSMAEKDEGT